MGAQAALYIDGYGCKGGSVDIPCKQQEGNVVKTINSGNTTIHFCDDFVIRDVSAINEILKRYERIGWDIFQSQREG